MVMSILRLISNCLLKRALLIILKKGNCQMIMLKQDYIENVYWKKSEELKAVVGDQ